MAASHQKQNQRAMISVNHVQENKMTTLHLIFSWEAKATFKTGILLHFFIGIGWCGLLTLHLLMDQGLEEE